jgi:hypothetical protein
LGRTVTTRAIGGRYHFSDLLFSVLRVLSATADARASNYERIGTMSESLIDSVLYDEESLSDALPDVALEVAAGKYWEVGNPFTIAFCSGLDTCPA